MTMPFTRYSYVRERLIFLFNILNNRVYPVWIAPRTMMSLDQLRDREEYRQDGFANDTEFYNTQQLRQMRVPQVLDILENVTSTTDLGFGNANKSVVEIYESIQEYIRLWCEIINTNVGFSTPPREELRLLESLAYLIFPTYKAIKPFITYQNNHERFKGDNDLNKKGLAGFAMLFSTPGIQGPKDQMDYSFVSYLDELDGGMGSGNFVPMESINTGPTFLTGSSLADSISKLDRDDSENSWIFKG